MGWDHGMLCCAVRCACMHSLPTFWFCFRFRRLLLLALVGRTSLVFGWLCVRVFAGWSCRPAIVCDRPMKWGIHWNDMEGALSVQTKRNRKWRSNTERDLRFISSARQLFRPMPRVCVLNCTDCYKYIVDDAYVFWFLCSYICFFPFHRAEMHVIGCANDFRMGKRSTHSHTHT